ncbi:AbrB family transcriptional regulator [Oscillospiraceae bacterium LTW-04]|nr:AbrB family transcriptional regulator [Oscillospiraceae bacterium MB24-C1]
MNFLLTLFIAALAGTVFYKMRIPGGILVGAVVGIVLFNFIFGKAFMPSEAKVAAQIVSGAFIGVGVSREEIKQFRRLFKPLTILIGCMLVLNLTLGTIIYLISDMDLMTAMFCAVPGGMSNTPIIAAEMGADSTRVAVMQFIRMCAGIGIFPSVIKYFAKNHEKTSKPTTKEQRTIYSHYGFLVAAVAAAAGGLIGEFSNIPAGALLFSIIATIAAKQIFPACMLPGWIKRLAQMLAGAYIGTGISPKDIPQMKELLLPAVVMLAAYMLACIIIANILSRHTMLTTSEGMLAATPAGASDMALISADIGISSPDVIILQIGRMLSAVLIFPNVIHFIVGLF